MRAMALRKIITLPSRKLRQKSEPVGKVTVDIRGLVDDMFETMYDAPGIGLAAVSGAITSGLGYALWYLVVKDLRTSLAAIVQLAVPVLAAAAGVILLGEQLKWRMVLASAAILGGVALALAAKRGGAKEHNRTTC